MTRATRYTLTRMLIATAIWAAWLGCGSLGVAMDFEDASPLGDFLMGMLFMPLVLGSIGFAVAFCLVLVWTIAGRIEGAVKREPRD